MDKRIGRNIFDVQNDRKNNLDKKVRNSFDLFEKSNSNSINNKENDVNINDMFNINIIEKEIKNILLDNIIKSDMENLFFEYLNIK